MLPSEIAVDRLVNAGVIDSVMEDEVTFDPEFVSDLDSSQLEAQRDSSSEQSGLWESLDIEAPVREALVDTGHEEFTLLSTCSTVDGWTADATSTETIQLALVVDVLLYGPTDTSGCPEGFLPIHGIYLPVITSLFDKALCYLWREDCPPCDTVRSILEDTTSHTDNSFGLFAVYGPGCPQFLEDVYDVVGAPTVLFIANGRIDSRVQGVHGPGTIESEIEILDSIAGTSEEEGCEGSDRPTCR